MPQKSIVEEMALIQRNPLSRAFYLQRPYQCWNPADSDEGSTALGRGNRGRIGLGSPRLGDAENCNILVEMDDFWPM